MIAARFVESLAELAAELARQFPGVTLADGTMPGLARIEQPLPRGLVTCPTCGTAQRPGAVHFATVTALRPCAGSWRRP
ncbi:MAG TPA: hypothetical protein VJU58_04030 [Microbacterium sp.]|nr:hypothetical protein [Microbacterium sp.]